MDHLQIIKTALGQQQQRLLLILRISFKEEKKLDMSQLGLIFQRIVILNKNRK